MAVTAESFRWLDILEKEFDKSFVDLDLIIGKFKNFHCTTYTLNKNIRPV